VQCPYCDGDSSVTETRLAEGGLRRRRVCSQCKRRFTTYEKVGSPSLKVDKRDGRSEPFDGDKLLRSLVRVSRGRAALPADVLRRLARDIEAGVVDGGHRSVRWSDLVVAVLRRLGGVDGLATTRYRANYVDDRGELRLEKDVDPGDPRQARSQLGLPGVEE